ncbi:ATP-binding protein [bacterium]|nr:ATP-binding protein [bacterium]
MPLYPAAIAALPAAEVQKICAGEVVERPLSVVKELVENALDAGASEISVELAEGGKRLIRVIDNGHGIAAGQLELAILPHHTSKIRSLEDLYHLGSLGFRGEALASIGAVSRLRISSFETAVAEHAPPANSPESWVLSPDEDLPPPTQGASGEAVRLDGPNSAHGTQDSGHRTAASASRTQDSGLRTVLGASIEVHGGQSHGLASSQLRRGTEVEVSDLFFNVPARLKFLRSAQSESSQVAGLLTAYALAYPEVRWKLISTDAKGGPRTLLASDGDGDLAAVLRDLLGSELSEGMAPLGFEFPPMSLGGYVSAPHRHWHNRTRQWFFVNRRPVVNKLLYRAVDDAMREFLSPGKFPAGVFLLELPPEEIDVNVHPAKTEINFAQPQAVYSLLTSGIRRALGAAAAARQRELTRGMSVIISPVDPRAGSPPPAGDIAPISGAGQQGYLLSPPLLEEEAPPGHRAIPVFDPGSAFASTPAERRMSEVGGLTRQWTPGEQLPPQAGGASSGSDIRHSTFDSPVSNLRPSTFDSSSTLDSSSAFAPVPQHIAGPVQQIADSYLLLATGDEIYLIDQHAAHERVLFESFWERLYPEGRSEPPQRQRLLFPMLIPLSPAEAEAASEALPAMASLGFAAQLGVGSQLVVDEVPALLAGRIAAPLLQAVLSELADPLRMSGEALELAGAELASAHGETAQSGPRQARPLQTSAAFADRMKYLAASLACKAAIKAGQPLPPDERASLLRLILSRWSSLTCPHGRPTVIRLGPGELERMFLR